MPKYKLTAHVIEKVYLVVEAENEEKAIDYADGELSFGQWEEADNGQWDGDFIIDDEVKTIDEGEINSLGFQVHKAIDF